LSRSDSDFEFFGFEREFSADLQSPMISTLLDHLFLKTLLYLYIYFMG